MSCAPCRDKRRRRIFATLGFLCILLAVAIGFLFRSECADAQPVAGAGAGKGCGPWCPTVYMGSSTWTVKDAASNTMLQVSDQGANSWIVMPGSGSEITNDAGNGKSGVAFFTTVLDLTMPNGGSARFRDPSLNTLGSVVDTGTTGQLQFDLYSTKTNNGAFTFEDQTGNDLATLTDLGTQGRFSVQETQTDFVTPRSGAVVTIEDSAGNDMATFTDVGTTGTTAINGTLTVNGAGTTARPFCTGCAHAGLLALTAIATSSSTTPGNVSELSWSVPVGNADLVCEFQARSAATTTGIQVGVDVNNAPASINGSCETWTGAAAYTRATFNTDDGTCAFTDAASASPASMPYRMVVHIVSFGSPSTVTVRLRSEVGASAVSLDPGSWCTLASS